MRLLPLQAVDVYSFGVLLWQMYTSSRPWSGLTHSQILMLVAQQGAKLQFPTDTPEAYRSLALSCMATDPGERPPMDCVVKVLSGILDLVHAPTDLM